LRHIGAEEKLEGSHGPEAAGRTQSPSTPGWADVFQNMRF
jgi:hypothetical protein